MADESQTKKDVLNQPTRRESPTVPPAGTGGGKTDKDLPRPDQAPGPATE